MPWLALLYPFLAYAERLCERLEEVAAHARKTVRLEAALLDVALCLGGEAGLRLASGLGLTVGPGALLDRLRRKPAGGVSNGASEEGVRVLGVDD